MKHQFGNIIEKLNVVGMNNVREIAVIFVHVFINYICISIINK